MEARSLSDSMIFLYAMAFSFLLCPFKELDAFLQASVQINNPHPAGGDDMTTHTEGNSDSTVKGAMD